VQSRSLPVHTAGGQVPSFAPGLPVPPPPWPHPCRLLGVQWEEEKRCRLEVERALEASHAELAQLASQLAAERDLRRVDATRLDQLVEVAQRKAELSAVEVIQELEDTKGKVRTCRAGGWGWWVGLVGGAGGWGWWGGGMGRRGGGRLRAVMGAGEASVADSDVAGEGLLHWQVFDELHQSGRSIVDMFYGALTYPSPRPSNPPMIRPHPHSPVWVSVPPAGFVDGGAGADQDRRRPRRGGETVRWARHVLYVVYPRLLAERELTPCHVCVCVFML
jgi:hypothetical protein